MSELRVIKRYANRKLYDTRESRYVTLEQIAEMIREGDDIKIVDNKSKEDLTSITLAQILFEEEKKQKSFLPLQTMRNIIQTGGESITQFVNQAKRNVSNILPQPRKSGEGEGPEASAELADTKGVPGASSLREFREWIQQSQHTIDEWQRRADDRIRNMVEGISPFAPLQKDLRLLASRIGELEEKLAQLNGASSSQALPPGPPSGGDERS